ncbi:MAG: beta-ketoacyl-[acyl-carrier-protein] synthase family protein [Candidatus Bipolaricaulia bacterium]
MNGVEVGYPPDNPEIGMQRNRVVITGIGFLTAIGEDKDTLWNNVLNGVSGVREISKFDATPCRTRIAATLDDFQPRHHFSERAIGRLDRVAQYAIVAASKAFADAKLNPEQLERDRVGVILGTSFGGIETTVQESGNFYLTGRFSPLTIPMAMNNAAAFEIATRFSLKGTNLTISTACSSSSNAIGLALNIVRSGQLDMVVAGGMDAGIVLGVFRAMDALRVMSTSNENPVRACKPFSKNRDGIVFGEGSGVVICEELEHALERGAPIYGELVGYGTSCDAIHLTSPQVEEEAIAMRMALADARLAPEAIDYINAHGTATLLNDPTETQAIKQVFGPQAYRISVNSSKPLLGHAQGASGVLELIVALLSMQSGIVHRTINYEAPDEDCDLDYVIDGNRSVEINTFMSNSFGFGGNNAVLVVKHYEP